MVVLENSEVNVPYIQVSTREKQRKDGPPQVMTPDHFMINNMSPDWQHPMQSKLDTSHVQIMVSPEAPLRESIVEGQQIVPPFMPMQDRNNKTVYIYSYVHDQNVTQPTEPNFNEDPTYCSEAYFYNQNQLAGDGQRRIMSVNN